MAKDYAGPMSLAERVAKERTRPCRCPGRNPATVSVILGHSNITTTMNLYVHPDNKEKKRCIERMPKDIL